MSDRFELPKADEINEENVLESLQKVLGYIKNERLNVLQRTRKLHGLNPEQYEQLEAMIHALPEPDAVNKENLVEVVQQTVAYQNQEGIFIEQITSKDA